MKKTVIRVGILALICGLVFTTWRLYYPSFSWHQKLTIEVETPEGVRTGFAVLGIKASYVITLGFSEVGEVQDSWWGEATFVELPDGRYLVALIGQEPAYFAQNVFKTTEIGGENGRIFNLKRFYRKLRKFRKIVSVPFEFYPVLVTFDNINDPTSLKRVKPDDFAAIFGMGYRLKSMTLAVTGEPVSTGKIARILPCLDVPEACIPLNRALSIGNSMSNILNSQFSRTKR